MFSFSPEEFIVEEITLDGSVLEVGKNVKKPNAPNGKFCHFVLEKKLWNTSQALNAIARYLRSGRKRFNAAGAKDRNAVTVQLCSGFALKPEQLLSVKIKDININGAWLASEKLKLGDLLGNRFTITLTEQNAGGEVSAEKIEKKARESNYLFPNLFGPQRFGSLRQNSQVIGKLFIEEKWNDAVLNFLTYTDGMERNKEAIDARKKLASELDFKAALDYYPSHLKFERTILGHLVQHPTDYIGALRKLPRHTLLLFLHAYQSYLFNILLRRRIESKTLFDLEKGQRYCEATGDFGFPDDSVIKTAGGNFTEEVVSGKVFPVANLVGTDSELTEDEKNLLEVEGVAQAQFNLKSMPELSSKGTVRTILAPISDFAVLSRDHAKITFALPSGSYATVALAYLLNRKAY